MFTWHVAVPLGNVVDVVDVTVVVVVVGAAVVVVVALAPGAGGCASIACPSATQNPIPVPSVLPLVAKSR